MVTIHPVNGWILLFAVTLSWKYEGKYKHMYTAWEENGSAGTPVFGLELAKVHMMLVASHRKGSTALFQHIMVSISTVHAVL